MSFRLATIQRAREIWAEQPVFVDTETTGTHNAAEIIEVGVVDWDGKVLFESFSKPRKPIPPEIVKIHGITNEMVAQTPGWLPIWARLEMALRGRNVGTYNAEFDLRMLQQSHQVNGMPWRPPAFRMFCVMKMYAEFAGLYKWPRLEDVGRELKIPLPNSHRATDDALLARAVFLYIVNFQE